MEQLTRNVFVETGIRGCNHGFVTTSDGIVMIDSPHKPSDALKLNFINLMSQPGETLQFTASDHVQAIHEHARRKLVEVAVCNSAPIPNPVRKRYARQQAQPIETDAAGLAVMGVRVIERPLAAPGPILRHDSAAIAGITVELAAAARRRRLRLRSA